jgi:hypothetical protein
MAGGLPLFDDPDRLVKTPLPARQDEGAAARAASAPAAEDTSLGLLPPEPEAQSGVDPAQIMGIIGAVLGKSPAGRGLQAAAGMMQQRQQSGQDRLARQRERMLQTEQVMSFLDTTAANLEPLDKGSVVYNQVRENALSIVPGGEAYLNLAEKNFRSMADNMVEYRAFSPMVDDFFRRNGGDFEATLDFVNKNFDAVNQQIFDNKDRRNLAAWPDLFAWQEKHALENFPEQIQKHLDAGGTMETWLQFVDSRMPDGDGPFAPDGPLKMNGARNTPEAKAKTSTYDTALRHPEEFSGGKIQGPIEGVDRVDVIEIATGKSLGSYRKGDPALEQYEGDPRYHIGKVSITGTRAEALGLEKPTKGALEKKVISGVDALARLDAMEQGFEERFLTTPNIIRRAIAERAERSGISLPESEKREVAAGDKFKQDVLENLNLYIKDITGAQMSAQEATRLTAALPNMDNSPTVFKTRIKNSIQKLRLAVARSTILLNEGLDVAELSKTEEIERVLNLADTRKLLMQVAEGEMATLVESGVDEESAFNQARESVRQQYGVDLGEE